MRVREIAAWAVYAVAVLAGANLVLMTGLCLMFFVVFLGAPVDASFWQRLILCVIGLAGLGGGTLLGYRRRRALALLVFLSAYAAMWVLMWAPGSPGGVLGVLGLR